MIRAPQPNTGHLNTGQSGAAPQEANAAETSISWAFFALGLLGPLESRVAGFWAAGMWVSAFEGIIAGVIGVGLWSTWKRAKASPAGASAVRQSLTRPVSIALGLWAAVHVVSALWSTGHAAMSLKFGLRMSGGVLLAWLAMTHADRPVVRRRLIAGLLGGLAAVTALGVAERGVGQAMEPVLRWFRDEPTWMLGEQRVSSVFYHANTLALYLELLLPLVLVMAAGRSLGRARRGLWLAWLMVCGGLLSLTYSRAGLLAGVLGAGLLSAVTWFAQRSTTQADDRDLSRLTRWAGSFALLLIVAFGANPDMRARLGVGAREYKVDYTIRGGCYAVGGHSVEVFVELHNRGNWPLSNRQAPGQLAWTLWDGGKTPAKTSFSFIDLPQLKPGARVDIPVTIRLPDKPGRYTALFDVRRKNVIWLSSIGNDLGRLPCISRRRGEPLLAADLQFGGHKGLRTLRKRRIELTRKHYWQAASRLLAERPVLGHGADRFRLEHRRFVPQGAWDSRARSHSVIVETAANLGILGLLALGLLAGAVAQCVFRVLTNAGAVDRMILAASIAVCCFALHSLVDYFLAYTKILAVAWPLLGLACVNGERSTSEQG